MQHAVWFHVNPDTDKRGSMAVRGTFCGSGHDLFAVLQNNLGSRYVNNITLDGQINKVIVQADFSARQDIPDISKLYVPNASGKLIQVKNFLNEKIVLIIVTNFAANLNN